MSGKIVVCMMFAGGFIFAPMEGYSQGSLKKTFVSADSAQGTDSLAKFVGSKKVTVSPGDSASFVHVSVDVPAKFPGGDSEWRKYLEKNFKRDLVIENGAPPGNYTIVVSFVVGVDGSISDVKAENNPGYGAAEQAVRLIKNGPKWVPAKKDGRLVAYRQRQSIVQCTAEE